MYSAKEIVNICDGRLYSGVIDTLGENFSTDTRTIEPGDIFIGIKGDNFNGNEYYLEAFKKGAKIALIEENYLPYLGKTYETIIIVKDAVNALKLLAEDKLNKVKPTVIAITGSVGKTTTRDMIYSVVKNEFKTLKTEKNYNNHLGVPLTVLKLKDEEVLILELGMNHEKEIEYLSNMVRPDIGVITNVYPVHVENLGSIENVKKAKLEILKGFKQSSKLIYNIDSLNVLENIVKESIGIDQKADLIAYDISNDTFKVKINNIEHEFSNQIKTKGYIYNILITIAVCMELNISIDSIKEGLKNFSHTEDRLDIINTKSNVKIINDTYNASAASMMNAIDYLKTFKDKRKIAILGDINELGKYAKEEHSKVGKYINGVDVLIATGKNAKYIYDFTKLDQKYYFNTKEESKEFVKNFLKSNDIVLVKASNGNKFIEIVEFIKNNF